MLTLNPRKLGGAIELLLIRLLGRLQKRISS